MIHIYMSNLWFPPEETSKLSFQIFGITRHAINISHGKSDIKAFIAQKPFCF